MGTDAQTNLAVPAELRASPPRRARRYRRKWAALLLLPYVLVGIGLLAFPLAELLLIFATPALDGRVVQLYTTTSGHGGIAYRAKYGYISNSKPLTGSDGVTPKLYKNLMIGAEVRVHAVTIGSRRISEMEKPAPEYWTTHWSLWVLTVVWNLVLFLHLRVRSIPRRLIERGTAVVGRIIDKEVIGRDSATARFQFTFNTRDGQTINAVEGVAAWRCENLSKGDQAIVLYDPAWPRRAILYACSDFRVD